MQDRDQYRMGAYTDPDSLPFLFMTLLAALLIAVGTFVLASFRLLTMLVRFVAVLFMPLLLLTFL